MNEHISSLSNDVQPVVHEFPSVLERIHLTSQCIEDQRSQLEAVRVKRQQIVDALGQHAKVEPDVYRPMEIELTTPGFGSCDADVSNASVSLREALDALVQSIRPSATDISVYGYADERPLRACPHIRDNMQLAELRAKSVAAYLARAWQLDTEPQSYGRLFPLARTDCSRTSDQHAADLCHEQNRRIRLQLSSDGFQFRVPDSCQRKQVAMSSG